MKKKGRLQYDDNGNLVAVSLSSDEYSSRKICKTCDKSFKSKDTDICITCKSRLQSVIGSLVTPISGRIKRKPVFSKMFDYILDNYDKDGNRK